MNEAKKPLLLKKITVATVCGKIQKKEIPDKGESREMMLVYGEVRRSVTGTSDYGDFLKFKGSYEAVNIETGEVFRSMNLILPADGQDMVEEVLSLPGVDTARFAFKVSIVGDDTNIGYHYQVEHIGAAQTADPLESMRRELLSANAHPALAALPAPDADKEPVANQAETPPKKKTGTK